jgi:hypothetical protein
MSRFFFFLIGTYAGYHIATKYDLKKLKTVARKEFMNDPECQKMMKKISNWEKEMQKKKEEE